MGTLKTFLLGLLLGVATGAALGYNHGRGAPLLSNPFADYGAEDALIERASELGEEARRRLREALE